MPTMLEILVVAYYDYVRITYLSNNIILQMENERFW
jgi:hypothetical protein